MNKKINLLCLPLLFLPFLIGAQSAQSLAKIQGFADSILFLELDNFMYSRQPHEVPKRSMVPFNRFVSWVDSIKIEEVHQFLKNENPKIRALGLLALYQFDRLESLPVYQQFTMDTAYCFKQSPFQLRSNMVRYSDEKISNLLQQAPLWQVADLGKKIMRNFYEHSSYYGEDPWVFINERKNYQYTAGFLTLLGDKATQRTTPTPPERKPQVDQLMSILNSIPQQRRRNIYKIYVCAGKGGYTYEDYYPICSREEVLSTLKELGKKDVLALLQKKCPISDPDLNHLTNSYNRYSQMCRWILRNAEVVFDINDVPVLLALGEFEANKQSDLDLIYWYTAAAKLDSLNAAQYLKQGLTRFSKSYDDFERAELYEALWRRCGHAESAFILNWLFGCYQLNEEKKESTRSLISRLSQPKDLELCKKIIQDPRFANSIHVETVCGMAKKINEILLNKPIPEQLIESVWHPYGLDRVEWWRDKALAEYPEETRQMLKNTESLKQALRKWAQQG